jgi:hypothetical protein
VLVEIFELRRSECAAPLKAAHTRVYRLWRTDS